MLGHRAKIITEAGDFVFGVQGALGVSPLPPDVQDEAVRIEFLDRQGIRCRYVFGTFAEFFRTLEEAAVRVDEQNAGISEAGPNFETELSSPVAGAPQRFRDLVAHALRTTDSAVLDAAERDYRGVYSSVHDFICNQVGEHLPVYLQWLLACCDPEMLRAGYERGLVRVWTIKLAETRRIVFESPRDMERAPGMHVARPHREPPPDTRA